MTRGLAFRKHHEKRSKAKAKRQLKQRWNWSPPEGKPEPTDREIGFHARTPKVCSGPCCGNPRRYFGELPIYEQRLHRTQFLP